MTTNQAQVIVANYIQGWCNDVAPDFIEDSINGGTDQEAIDALALVGTNFDWSIEMNHIAN